MNAATYARQDDYASFLLRMWREDLNGDHCWRATLQDTQTREEHYFTDLQALVDFLRTQFSESTDPADTLGQKPGKT